ncbi:hypothetical protein [Limnoglobus roseus]|uniref:Uncharacterized protein n=1 Tax=Limnoglobus roseus TaxID=2598579 RepID=A0A5C1AI49_9BACT|nr:hypothetical protein [Limnoglobus roseus]QEL16638.1 hypothetical protein PX52LOC_03598 [Limnoglobus roseus]
MVKASFQHATLGKLTRGTSGWDFTFPLARGRLGQGTICTVAPGPRPPAESLEALQGYLAWFRRNETRLRGHIANKMFAGWRSGWYDPEIDHTTTALGFQRKIGLAGINFYWDERWVSLVYNDGGLFGGHAITLSTDLVGKIDRGPTMFG